MDTAELYKRLRTQKPGEVAGYVLENLKGYYQDSLQRATDLALLMRLIEAARLEYYAQIKEREASESLYQATRR